MSWLSDIFLPGTAQTSDEQAANFARQEADLNARLAARENAGTISASQDASYNKFLDSLSAPDNGSASSGHGGGLINQDSGTLDSFINDAAYKQYLKNTDQDQPASVTDLILDLVILAALVAVIWLFGSFGGFILARRLVSTKNTVGLVGLGLAVSLWAFGLVHYGKKAWSDFNSVKTQGLSLFGL